MPRSFMHFCYDVPITLPDYIEPVLYRGNKIPPDALLLTWQQQYLWTTFKMKTNRILLIILQTRWQPTETVKQNETIIIPHLTEIFLFILKMEYPFYGFVEIVQNDLTAHAYYFGLKTEKKSVFLGNDLKMSLSHGIKFDRRVNPQILVRIKGLCSAGL